MKEYVIYDIYFDTEACDRIGEELKITISRKNFMHGSGSVSMAYTWMTDEEAILFKLKYGDEFPIETSESYIKFLQLIHEKISPEK